MRPATAADRPYLRSGLLQGIGVPDLMWDLCRKRKTGTVRFHRSGVTRAVHFEEGRIVFASSDDPNERLGEMLVRDGLITLAQFEKAASQLDSGRRLGTLLVQAGHLTTENLVRSVLAQVRGIVLDLFSWEEGEYAFDEGPLPREEMIQLGVHTGELIVQGIRQIRSFTLIRGGVGSPRTRYGLTEGWRERLGGVALTDGETLLLERLEGGPRSVEKLCQELYLSNFEIYQALWAFKVLRAVDRVEPGADEALGERDQSAGRLDQQEFVAVLVRSCRAGKTGVLDASNASVDRTFHIKEGRCVFATSTNADDGLVAHLLRRGVISLRDREEVSRRLLTNRRVGTLLLELGVLDETDLARVVREHVCEIVYDTARWQEGEWSFTPGELPTIEEITLDISLEDLVLHAVRQVTSWSRIVRGAGGLDAWLALTPRYLEVLDHMNIGGDEWDVVASLGGPRTVREVCQAHPLGDFRICQMLWALRLLEAVAEVPAPVIEAPAEEAASVQPEPEPEMKSWRVPVLEERTEAVGDLPAASAFMLESDRPKSAAGTAEESAAPVPAQLLEILGPYSSPALDSSPSSPAHEEAAPPPELRSHATEGPRFELAEPGSAPERYFGATIEERAQGPQEMDRAPWAAPEKPPFSSVFHEPPEGPAGESLAESIRAEGAPPEPPELKVAELTTAWAPAEERPIDPELKRQIERFNACQRLVYRAVRTEVGAGAANFLRFCGGKLTDGFNELFASVDLMDDGAWDVSGLQSSIQRKALLDPWLGFQRLLDKELEMVHVHLGVARAEELRKRIEDFERKGFGPSD